MKRVSLIALLLSTSSTYALNAVQGWYAGILLGLNYTPSVNFIYPTNFIVPSQIPITLPTNVPVTLTYGHLGQIDGQIGYRICNFRVEGQIGYNGSPYSSLKVNNKTLLAPSTSPYYNFSGYTGTAYGMINGYYDVMPSDPDSNFVPFLGLGIGYAGVGNTINMDFYYDKNNAGETVPGYEVLDVNIKQTSSSAAGQVMIGASYFLDDFASFSLDLRYFTTQKKSPISNARVEFATVNLTFNGAFNAG